MGDVLTVPNALTALRIALVPAIVVLILRGDFAAALGVFLVAGVSDALDGFIARRFNQQSRLGSFLDPAADKLLVVSSVVVLAAAGGLPWWLAAVIVCRDIVIVAGATAYWRRTGHLEMEPTTPSKINTMVQVALILFIIAREAGMVGFPEVLLPFMFLSLLFAVLSGGHYVIVWARRVNR